MKLGLLILSVLAVALWLNHLKRRRQELRQLQKRQHDGPDAFRANQADSDIGINEAADKAAGSIAAVQPESIVGCDHCGLHVPASDAIVGVGGTSFCCDAHRRLHTDA
ncbi:MAG: PP0621 family protein [Pseudomonadota bacterium]